METVVKIRSTDMPSLYKVRSEDKSVQMYTADEDIATWLHGKTEAYFRVELRQGPRPTSYRFRIVEEVEGWTQ
jgi:hypothetical protein